MFKFDSPEHPPIQIDAVDHTLKVCYIVLTNFLIGLVKANQEVPIMSAIIFDRNCH